MNAALYGLRGLADSSNLNALQQTILFKQGDSRDVIVKGIYVPALKAIDFHKNNFKKSDLAYRQSIEYMRYILRQ